MIIMTFFSSKPIEKSEPLLIKQYPAGFSWLFPKQVLLKAFDVVTDIEKHLLQIRLSHAQRNDSFSKILDKSLLIMMCVKEFKESAESEFGTDRFKEMFQNVIDAIVSTDHGSIVSFEVNSLHACIAASGLADILEIIRRSIPSAPGLTGKEQIEAIRNKLVDHIIAYKKTLSAEERAKISETIDPLTPSNQTPRA